MCKLFAIYFKIKKQPNEKAPYRGSKGLMRIKTKQMREL
jgi:hypothetical protein